MDYGDFFMLYFPGSYFINIADRRSRNENSNFISFRQIPNLIPHDREMDELWINLLLVVGLTLSWIAAGVSGFQVFKQKLTPEYHPLPDLIRKHVNFGITWAILLSFSGIFCFVRSLGGGANLGPNFLPGLSLGAVSAAIVYTGYGLKKGKPTGVWVHVFMVLVATGLGLLFLSKYLWNSLF